MRNLNYSDISCQRKFLMEFNNDQHCWCWNIIFLKKVSSWSNINWFLLDDYQAQWATRELVSMASDNLQVADNGIHSNFGKFQKMMAISSSQDWLELISSSRKNLTFGRTLNSINIFIFDLLWLFGFKGVTIFILLS